MGELEAAVLGVLWAAGTPLTARQVQEGLPMPLARTTVATLLARLYGKGAVTREPAGRGYVYAAAQDRHGLTARRMHKELDKDADREVVLARFVSQLGPEDERILRELLEAQQELSGDGGDTGDGAGGAAGTATGDGGSAGPGEGPLSAPGGPPAAVRPDRADTGAGGVDGGGRT